MNRFLAHILLLGIFIFMSSWGFYAHKEINRVAVFSLPVEMIWFYKLNVHSLINDAVKPDMRRYIVPDEAPKHYIDLDLYYKDSLESIPKYWSQACEKWGEDSLKAKGIVPWQIMRTYGQLVRAFENVDPLQILRFSSDLGHYVADAHVPLHTTSNYNGQQTDQYGIHGLWESRLPELFSSDYNLMVGKAEYIDDVQGFAWQIVYDSHRELDKVLRLEKEISADIGEDNKYSYEERGSAVVRVHSYTFSKAYHDAMEGMVERRMGAAIKAVASLWFSAWVDAGQPILKQVKNEVEEVENEVLDENDSFVNHESEIR